MRTKMYTLHEFPISFYYKVDKKNPLQRFQSYAYTEVKILAKLEFLKTQLL